MYVNNNNNNKAYIYIHCDSFTFSDQFILIRIKRVYPQNTEKHGKLWTVINPNLRNCEMATLPAVPSCWCCSCFLQYNSNVMLILSFCKSLSYYAQIFWIIEYILIFKKLVCNGTLKWSEKVRQMVLFLTRLCPLQKHLNWTNLKLSLYCTT